MPRPGASVTVISDSLKITPPSTGLNAQSDGPSLCQFNPVVGGVTFNESEISVTQAPGLGIREIRGMEALAAA